MNYQYPIKSFVSISNTFLLDLTNWELAFSREIQERAVEDAYRTISSTAKFPTPGNPESDMDCQDDCFMRYAYLKRSLEGPWNLNRKG